MKKRLILITILILCITNAFADIKKGDVMYVTVQSAQLKERKNALSKNIILLDYAKSVIIIESFPEWSYIYLSDNTSVRGWISNGSLSKRKPSLDTEFTGNANELALAGKGFTEEMEDLYKQTKSLDFFYVDLMEAQTVDTEELKKFIFDGYLEGEVSE